MSKTSLRRQGTAALACALLLTPAVALLADDAPEPAPAEGEPATNLPPIIVQASRLDKTTMQMPASVRVITGEEIVSSGCATTAELLEKKGGVFIRTLNSTPALAQLAMRGFGDNSFGRVLVLVNGERLNNPDMAAPNLLRVPVGSISRIEIIRGPQSVLHGDHASAGVVNIITDEAGEGMSTTVGASAGAFDSYSGHLDTTGSFAEEGVSYRASLDWDKSGGYRVNSGHETYQANASLRKEFGENRHLSLSTFYHFAEYGLPGALDYHAYKHSPRRSTSPDDQSELESYGLNLGGRLTIGEDGYLDTHLTASRRRTDSRFQGISYGSPWLSLYHGDIYSYALTPQYLLDSDVKGLRNIFTLGSDLRYDDTSYISDYADPYFSSLLDWTYGRATMAGYAQDELFLAENLSLTLGGRMEWLANRVRARRPAFDASSFSSREHALDTALLYRPSDNTKIYAKAGRLYHSPCIDEIFAGAGLPNLDLDPETGYNFEIGAEAVVASEWRASLALYDMELKDEIYYDPTIFQNRNSPGDSRRLGLDTALEWSRRGLASIMLAYSAVQSEFTGGPHDGKRMPLVPRHTLSLNGEYTICHGVTALAGMRYVADQVLGSDFDNQAEKLKAYALADCGLRYEPTFLDGLRLNFSIENLFGKEYCDYAGWSSGGAYYYPARGRFWRLGAAYTF